ncbi:hypothetical protein [Luedemannella helvata]|uniref:CBM2 domain-containing protein n=1 Tax=Luedemannella helvata TaxID=349315 RepID=A0ABN2KB07_9ACTN
MGEGSEDAPPRPRRSSLLASIGEVENPAEARPRGESRNVAQEAAPAAEAGGKARAKPELMNDGERLVAFDPVDADDRPATGEPGERKPPTDPFAEFEAALAQAFPPPVAPTPPRRAAISGRQAKWIAGGAALILVVAALIVVGWPGRACCGRLDAPPAARPTGAPGIGPGAPGAGNAGPSNPPTNASGQPTGAPQASPPPAAGAPAAPQPSSARGGAAGTAAAPTSGAAPQADTGGLTATYRTSKPSLLGLLGYQGEITVRNPTSAPRGSWTVVVELAGDNQVRRAYGSVQWRTYGDGRYWFGPLDEGTIEPGGSYTFAFDVEGLFTGRPVSCTVDDSPCG